MSPTIPNPYSDAQSGASKLVNSSLSSIGPGYHGTAQGDVLSVPAFIGAVVGVWIILVIAWRAVLRVRTAGATWLTQPAITRGDGLKTNLIAGLVLVIPSIIATFMFNKLVH